MNKAPKSLSLLLLAGLLPVAMLLQTVCLEAQTARNPKADAQLVRRPLPPENEKDRMNA